MAQEERGFWQGVWRRNWLALVAAVALSIALVAGFFAIGQHYDKLVAVERSELRQRIAAQKFADKRQELELAFKLMYESIRTISLFPGVRDIKGGNRRTESEDVVREGRFPADAQQTVQQLYNNLASNLAVSEVYAVVDGFDARKGEVPFFMYDSLILNGGVKADEAGAKNPDEPEESEAAEYAYYPRQLAWLKAHHPRFDFKELGDVPAVISPLMRTCDNSQYHSLLHDHVQDTYGFLYSVPFYSRETGALRGIVSAIVRANVLEARLLDIPFLPVTADEKAKAKQQGVRLPAVPESFVLLNDKYGIAIFDRRNKQLLSSVRVAMQRSSPDLVHTALKVAGDSPWQLAFLITPAMYEEASRATVQEERTVRIAFVMIGMLLLAGLIGIVVFRHLQQASQVSGVVAFISELAGVETDLRRRIDGAEVSDDVAPIAHNINLFIDRLQQLIRRMSLSFGQTHALARLIRHSSSVIAISATETTRVTEHSSSLTDRANASLQQAGVNMLHVKDTMQSNSVAFQQMSEKILEVADRIGTVVQSEAEVGATVAQLEQQGAAIQGVLKIIQEIAEQTSLLALNAAIEAARAGEMGRGFAVVAGEVRSLANRTQQRLADINSSVNGMVRSVEAVSGNAQRNTERIRELALFSDGIHGQIQNTHRATAEAIEAVVHAESEVRLTNELLQELAEGVQKAMAASSGNRRVAAQLEDISQELGDATTAVTRELGHFRV